MAKKKLNENHLFFPFQPIQTKNDHFYSGRRKFVNRVLENLTTPGSTLIIYGERQVGKTSLANQVVNILNNKGSLKKDSLIEIPDFDRSTKCVTIDSSSFYLNIQGLLSSIILAEHKNSLKRQFPEAYSSRVVENIVSETEGFTLNLSVLKYKNEAKTEVKNDSEKISAPDIVFDYFRRLVDYIQENQKVDLVFVIDEFDLLDDKSGVGQLIKLMPDTRFIIVGIADNINELISDHKSVRAKLGSNKIKLPLFTEGEIGNIFELVQDTLKSEHGKEVQFDKNFKRVVYEDSGGLPGYAHLIGLNIIRIIKKNLKKDDIICVDSELYNKAVDKIFNLDLYEFYDDFDEATFSSIKEMIKEQPNNKEILFNLAEAPATGIEEDELYKGITEEYQGGFYDNLKSMLKDGMLKKVYGTNFVKFTDPLVRVSINVARKYRILE